jgi:predicted RNA-binding protein with PUA-like domain
MPWLLKTEPSDYSFADLWRDGRTTWSGVKNAAAQLHLRAMKAGDELLIYHTGDEKAVVGTAKVARAAFPDPTDPAGKRVAVEIEPVRPLPRPVPLAQIKAEPRFKGWDLLKIGRLSVVPTAVEVWERVLTLAQALEPGAANRPPAKR